MSITIDGDNITVQLETSNVNVSVGGAPVFEGGGGGGASTWGTITGTLSAQTDLQAELDAKQDAGSYAAAVHSHIISDVTGLQTALDGKAATAHSHIIGDVTNLQSTLDGKAATSHSHIITDVTGLQTQFDSRDFYFNILNAIGTDWLGETLTKFWEVNAGLVLTDGQMRYFPVWIKASVPITSVRFWQHVVGSYTADNENSISLFTYSAGTITRIATTGNVANLWQTGSSNSLRTENLSSPVSVSKGLHWLGFLYNQSAAVTPPQIGINTGMSNSGLASIGLSNSAKISGTVNTVTATPSSIAMSSITVSTHNNWAQVL